MLARNIKREDNHAGAIVMAIILLVGVWFGTAKAIDQYVDNQSTMLCKSARVSGNTEWLNKCSVYYKTGEIAYLR